MKISWLLFAATVLSLSAQNDPSSTTSGFNCTFKASPERYLSGRYRAWNDASQRAQQFQKSASIAKAAVAADDPIPHRNFIDDEIFDRLATNNVKSARLTSDEEFFRRINLDLTGR